MYLTATEAPTNEMHNFNPILIVQHDVTPLTPAHNFAIKLDCYARGRQIELGD